MSPRRIKLKGNHVSLNETQSVYNECRTVHYINTLLGKQRGTIKLP